MSYDPLDADSDPFKPPAISTLVACLHCGEEYDSYRIEWRVEACADGKQRGFWCCPIEECDGRGFGFDIFPVDPDYRDEDGNLMRVDDEDDEDEDDEDDEDELDEGTADGGDVKGNGEELPW